MDLLILSIIISIYYNYTWPILAHLIQPFLTIINKKKWEGRAMITYFTQEDKKIREMDEREKKKGRLIERKRGEERERERLID